MEQIYFTLIVNWKKLHNFHSVLQSRRNLLSGIHILFLGADYEWVKENYTYGEWNILALLAAAAVSGFQCNISSRERVLLLSRARGVGEIKGGNWGKWGRANRAVYFAITTRQRAANMCCTRAEGRMGNWSDTLVSIVQKFTTSPIALSLCWGLLNRSLQNVCSFTCQGWKRRR